MTPIFLLAAFATLSSAPARAGVDYKCDSVRYEDQLTGWLRLDGADRGSVEMEFWNGYPPVILVDAPISAARATREGATDLVTEADRHNGTVATFTAPAGYATADKFFAKIDMRYTSPENGKLRVMKYDLNCVRH
jgi:hypothetical protein